MRKALTILCILMLSLLISCQQEPANEHTFSKEWTYDTTHHWHEATCEHTDLVSGKAEHTFEDGVCTTCGYKQYWDNFKVSEEGVLSVNNRDELPTEIVIPGNLAGITITGISIQAFCDCTDLISVEFPDSITSIGSAAFEGCSSLASLTIPAGVEEIGGNAFYDCTGLESVTILGTGIEIGSGAFYNCQSIEAVYGSDLESWLGLLFEDSSSNPVANSSSCRLYLDNKPVEGAVTIPEGVTKINNSVFAGLTAITSVEIPNSVTSIGSGAFSACTGLTGITIPESVTEICDNAFFGCTGFKTITIPASVTRIEDYFLDGCTGLTEIKYSGTTEQWNYIEKGDKWSLYITKSCSLSSITCTNGSVAF